MRKRERRRSGSSGRPLAAVAWLVLALGGSGSAAGQTILYVDPGAVGANDGSSWSDAFVTLQDGLARAAQLAPPVEVRVAQGVYRPDQGAGQTPADRQATFTLRSGVALRGGYAGNGAPAAGARNPEAYPTILSGDLLGNDQPNWVNHYENSRHVVTAINVNATAQLDGLTVYGGYAEWSTWPDGSAAALRIENGSPTVTNCSFLDSLAHAGGGAMVYGGSPTFTDCRFAGNYAWTGRGGGMYVVNGSSPRLWGCTFENNTSYGPSSVGDGGAMFIEGGAVVRLAWCSFFNNSSISPQPQYANGGAICSLGDGLKVHHCVFGRNTAAVAGAVWTGGDAQFVGCTFTGNSALAGGAMMSFFANTTLTSCLFTRNDADDGGAIENGFSSQLTVTDSILWGNTAANAPSAYKAQLHNNGGTSSLSFSCVEGVFTPEPGEDPPDPADFPGCIESNPLMVDADGADNIAGTADDDGRLQTASPCIDAGKNSVLPADVLDLDSDGNTAEAVPVDLDGQPRRVDHPGHADTGSGTPPIVDMGPYEFWRIPFRPGDLDGDAEVDLADYAALFGCLTGPDATPPGGCAGADLDEDGDADLADWAAFARLFGS